MQELVWAVGKAFDEGKHPRHPAGSRQGGRFAGRFASKSPGFAEEDETGEHDRVLFLLDQVVHPGGQTRIKGATLSVRDFHEQLGAAPPYLKRVLRQLTREGLLQRRGQRYGLTPKGTRRVTTLYERGGGL
jgi:hypothetical protein